MKILILTDSLNRGGAEKQLVILAMSLASNYEVIVWSLHPGPFMQKLTSNNVPVLVHQGSSTYQSVYAALSTLIRSYSPDVAHFWGMSSLFAGFLPFRKARIPIVNGTVRYGARPKSLKIRLRITLAACIGDIIVANSSAGLRASQTIIKRKRVICNGFDIRSTENTKLYNIPDSLFNIIMCANITSFKDYPMFVETAKLTLNKHRLTNMKFWAIGSPSSNSHMRKVITQAGQMVTKGFLEFTGGVSNPLPYLMASDIGVLFSTGGEGISNSIMEYMACRLPVICSRVGGNPELIVDNVTGFLVNPENSPPEISEKILWLHDNYDEARKMGEAGYNRLVSEFSVEKMVSNTIQVYRELLRI